MHQHHIREQGDQTDRPEGLVAVMGPLRMERWIDGESRGIERQRVAIGRRLGHRSGPYLATGSGLVLDHHRLADQAGL